MIILSKKFAHAAQDFEIFVKYNVEEKRVIEIKNIMLHTHGNWYPVGGLMTKYFRQALDELIMATDWDKVYREMDAPEPQSRLHPLFEQLTQAFAPHVNH